MTALLDSVRELWCERSRVGLVIVGMVWGTLSLTLLFAFGSEMAATTTRTSHNLGRSLLRIGSGATTRPHQGMAPGRWVHRQAEDADLILAAVPGVEDVAIECIVGSGNPLEHDDVRMNVSLVGCSPNYGLIRNQLPQLGGRFLNRRDEVEHRQVVFLGHRTAERLFPSSDPIGKTVLLWGRPFTVVGVRRPLINTSNYSGDDRDKVFIPASTFRDLYGWQRISQLWVRLTDEAADPAARQALMDDVFAVLAARHGIHPDDRGAIWMMDYVEIEEMIGGITTGMRVFMGGVGLIGLLVALVGVANVTYVMVEERTPEIGVQVALGARPRDVARARVLESVLVTLTGGALGLAATAGILAAMNAIELGDEVRAYLGWPVVSPGVGLAVVALLAIGGCLAGWIPARRAAALDPVEAMREGPR